MKKSLLIFCISIISTFGYFVEGYSFSFSSDSNLSAAVRHKSSILLVERDVPQTRVGFEPVINHEVLIVNLSEETIELDIESPIPKGLYVIKKFYPTFGQESLLAMPMNFPKEVRISQYKILERPSIEKNEGIVFRWANVSIPSKHAVIAQYENYFGPLSQFYTKRGLKVADLHIHTSYVVSLEEMDKRVVFDLNYKLENKGKNEVEDILIDFILPDVVYRDREGQGITLFDVIEAIASSQVKIHRGMLGDGFGKAATGTIFTVSIPKLKQGQLNTISIKVEGIRAGGSGESYPLFTFQYRMKEGDRIWPPTVLKSKKRLEIERFYYYQLNIVLPDSKLFRFEPKGIKVVPIKGLP